MVHKFNLWWDAIYPMLCKIVGKRYGCCDRIKNCNRCIERMEENDGCTD